MRQADMLRWHGFLTAKAISRYFPNNWNMKSSPIYAMAYKETIRKLVKKMKIIFWNVRDLKFK